MLTVDFPTVCVASVMFGGEFDRLYVTTMLRAPVPGVVETGPLAGSRDRRTGRTVARNRYGG